MKDVKYQRRNMKNQMETLELKNIIIEVKNIWINKWEGMVKNRKITIRQKPK